MKDKKKWSIADLVGDDSLALDTLIGTTMTVGQTLLGFAGSCNPKDPRFELRVIDLSLLRVIEACVSAMEGIAASASTNPRYEHNQMKMRKSLCWLRERITKLQAVVPSLDE